jgi:hypothetical protein
MRVSDCEQCEYFRRMVWTKYYQPVNYHAIGINHAYGYCVKEHKRCLDVTRKECEEQEHE